MEITNLIDQISLEQISKITLYGEKPERVQLPRMENINLQVTEINETDLGATIVYKDEANGQEIDLRTLLSMYNVEGTKEVITAPVKVGDEDLPVIPFRKGVRLKEAIMGANKGLPRSIVLTDVTAVAGATKDYLNGNNKEAKQLAYDHFQVDTESSEDFPMLVIKSSNKSATEVSNWKPAYRTLTEAIWS